MKFVMSFDYILRSSFSYTSVNATNKLYEDRWVFLRAFRKTFNATRNVLHRVVEFLCPVTLKTEEALWKCRNKLIVRHGIRSLKSRDTQIFKTCRKNLEILGARSFVDSSHTCKICSPGICTTLLLTLI